MTDSYNICKRVSLSVNERRSEGEEGVVGGKCGATRVLCYISIKRRGQKPRVVSAHKKRGGEGRTIMGIGCP